MSHIAECDTEFLIPVIKKCDAESQVKSSMLSGLRYSLTTKTNLTMKLQAEIVKLQAEVVKLRTYLNTTQEDTLVLISEIHSITAPDILKLATCDGAFAIDCCQVSSDRTVFAMYAISV